MSPLYDYICECGNEFDEFKKIEDRKNAICPECGETPKQKITSCNFDSGVLRRADGKDMAGEYNIGLGDVVYGKSDLKRKAAAKGLKWIGDDPVPKKKKESAVDKVDWNAVAHDLGKAGVKN